jgi:tRNA threonylcarbamoyladenosine biosynthesis protein TsaE
MVVLMESHEWYLADVAAQEALAGKLARLCEPGTVIFIQGELGAGKTTFVRGFLQALGHQGVVKSPTYTLVEPYELSGMQIYHFDLYRLADAEDLEYAGGRDYFDGKSVCLVEWPERAAGFLPAPDLVCRLDYSGSGRQLCITAQSPSGSRMLRLISEYLL